LTLVDAVELYSQAWNRLDYSILEFHLSADIVYESQHVFSALEGKDAVTDYIRGKMETVRKSGQQVFAEVTVIPYGPGKGDPCVLLSQGSKENAVVLALLKLSEGKISRIDICGVAPDPKSAKRTGIYPGLESQRCNRKEGELNCIKKRE